MKMFFIFFTIGIICVIGFFSLFKFTINHKELKEKQIKIKTKTDDMIYCVMVTGKSEYRRNFALTSIKNFNRQNYTNKRLIIINEGDPLIISGHKEDILEIIIHDRKEKKLTLGDMRNIAFDFIPEEGIWTLWDDDDWRCDNYLSILFSNLGNDDFVFLTKRTEYNIKSKLVWVMELKTGFVIMFGRKKWQCKYDSKEFNEDIMLKNYVKENFRYKLINNDPVIYLRNVHEDNTSILVNKNKSEIKDTKLNKYYFEIEATSKIKDYVEYVIGKHYSFINN
jgi:hypothetical protein